MTGELFAVWLETYRAAVQLTHLTVELWVAVASVRDLGDRVQAICFFTAAMASVVTEWWHRVPFVIAMFSDKMRRFR